jgi:two-component system NtrC family sensor kinase
MSNQKETPLVLVADDEVHTTIMLTRIFEREGYQVESVHDGASAVSAAQHLMPDLILLDIQMPLMNGFDVLRTLRENALTVNIPTIIITAKARQASDVAHGLNLGADDFVHKPFDPRELLARAQSKIRARKLEDALQRRSQELEALLRVGEELNQHLEVKELLNLVPYLVLDLLPGSAAAIYHLDDNLQLLQVEIRGKDIEVESDSLNHQAIIQQFLEAGAPILWTDSSNSIIGDFNSGMIVPLKHGTTIIGILLLLAQVGFYDESHLRLFEGIGGQAALALRNAQLYDIQANYAVRLEDMVEAKTTELKSAQQMLIRAEKLASIGHLAASIAHEINNPLQPIRIMLEDMLEDVQNKVPVDIKALQITHENVERIWRIVSQLLDFAGKRSTSSSDIQLIDIGTVIDSVVSLNKKFFQKEDMKIIAKMESPLQAYGNKDQLEQVFMNLILNAKAAMERGGTLKIEVHRENNEIVAEFTDNGCGIPPERINQIFDPFFSTKPNGTGLGLFVSYGIVQSHHGTLEVKSKVNKGTTFTMRLPAYEAPT